MQCLWGFSMIKQVPCPSLEPLHFVAGIFVAVCYPRQEPQDVYLISIYNDSVRLVLTTNIQIWDPLLEIREKSRFGSIYLNLTPPWCPVFTVSTRLLWKRLYRKKELCPYALILNTQEACSMGHSCGELEASHNFTMGRSSLKRPRTQASSAGRKPVWT